MCLWIIFKANVRLQEAYELAENFQLVEVYANAIESVGNQQHFAQLSDYFSASGKLMMAGKFAGLAKNYTMVPLSMN